MDDNTNPLRTTPSLPPRSGEVVVKGLEWHGPDYEGEYWAASIAERYVIRAPNGNGYWLGGVGGYFPSVDEAKAAAEKHHQARIRSTLADPIPEAPADEEVGGPDVGLARDEWLAAASSPQIERWALKWADVLLDALRRSTKTDKPGVREALEWYAEQVGNCRKLHSEGDAARKALNDDCGKRARDALSASPLTEEQPVAEGWKLVPLDPTEAMIGHTRAYPGVADDDIADIYRAMLAAAPLPRSTTGGAKCL